MANNRERLGGAPAPERMPRRRLLVEAGLVAGGVVVGGLVFGPLGWRLGRRYEQGQIERVRQQVRYVDLPWRERPDLAQTGFDVIRFSGDTADDGKSRKERTRVGLLGMTRAAAHEQLVAPGRQVGVVFWAPSGAHDGRVVAHAGLLGSVDNLGVIQRLAEQGEPAEPSRQTVDVLTVGVTLAGGAIAVTMAGVEADNFVPLRGVEGGHVMSTETLGRYHTDIPVV